MKSLRQSRIDRLARRIKQKTAAEKKAIKDLDKNIGHIRRTFEKILNRELAKKCPHGKPYSGRWCFACYPDAIADTIREIWAPTPTYVMNVFIHGEDPESYRLTLPLKTRNPTKKIMEMQENGFWYVFQGKPVFMLPEMIRVVQLDSTARSPYYTDPSDLPFSEEPVGVQRAPQSQYLES